MSTETALVLGVTTFVAAFAQGTTGLGFAMILAPVIGFVEPGLLPIIVLILMLPLNGYVVLRERHALDIKNAGWITIGRAVGTLGGLWLLLAIPSGRLGLLIGVATVLAVLATLFVPPFDPARKALMSAGVVTGVTETATGIGGPPLALVYQHRPAPAMRSTLAACFLIGEIFSLALLAGAEKITVHHLTSALLLLPPLVAGGWLSHATHHRVDGPLMRTIILIFALGSGVVLILQS